MGESSVQPTTAGVMGALALQDLENGGQCLLLKKKAEMNAGECG